MNREIMGIVWLAALVAVVVAECAHACPEGYTQRPGGNCYKVSKAKRQEWYYADQTCKKEGGFLASMRSKSEGDWVNTFYGKNKDGGDCCTEWFWIGVNDIAKEGQWVYTENGEPANYFYWHWDGADNRQQWEWTAAGHVETDEDAVQVNYRSREWKDGAISKKYCFVCETLAK